MKDDIAKIRAERLAKLMSGETPINESPVSSTTKERILVARSLNIHEDNLEWLSNYTYTISSKIGRVYNLSEAVDAAISQFRNNYKGEMQIRPTHLQRRRKKH